MKQQLTPTELNNYIKRMVQNDFVLNNVLVSGEVSNFKQARGNYYFSIKDENASVSCIIFSNVISDINIEDGMNILVEGRVSVYEKTGTYSIYVRSYENIGLGKYYLELQKLKQKLLDNGMLDEENKKQLPEFAMNIGVVTAKTGAAIQDIKRTIKNKNPYARIILYPAKVQGEGAADTISEGIDVLDKMGLDVIIIGRGGGSIEDLYCFNDEKVAYSIFAAKTPIISAVGHEIDYSISDLVADKRAATPTAAAELATFNYYEFIDTLDEYKDRLNYIIDDRINELYNRIDDYKIRLGLCSPNEKINQLKLKLQNKKEKLKFVITSKINDYKNRLKQYSISVESKYVFSKKDIIYITNKKGKRINSINEVKLNEEINIDFSDGRLVTTVNKKVKR